MARIFGEASRQSPQFDATHVLIRIVRMTFRPESVDEFLALFDDSAGRIRSFKGCSHLELWHSTDQSNVFTTFSLWSDADALDAYRHSPLFRSTWKVAKSFFAQPPEASSYTQMRSLN